MLQRGGSQGHDRYESLLDKKGAVAFVSSEGEGEVWWGERGRRLTYEKVRVNGRRVPSSLRLQWRIETEFVAALEQGEEEE